MEVIEEFIKGKYEKQELCEDAIIVSKNFIAVIDGVTSQENPCQGKALGKIISDILENIIPTIPEKSSCDKAISYLNEKILEEYKNEGIYDLIKDDPRKQPAASVVIYSKFYNQIWMIGDCKALYGNTIIDNELEVDIMYAKLRKILIEYLLETGCTEDELLENDITRQFLEETIKRQPLIRNKRFYGRYDYVSIDGFNKLDIDLIKIVDVPKDVSEIAFCTDGYRKIFATLKECEEYNKFIKENDPLCYKEYWHERGFVKNQESYDDRAYIRFKI